MALLCRRQRTILMSASAKKLGCRRQTALEAFYIVSDSAKLMRRGCMTTSVRRRNASNVANAISDRSVKSACDVALWRDKKATKNVKSFAVMFSRNHRSYHLRSEVDTVFGGVYSYIACGWFFIVNPLTSTVIISTHKASSARPG